MQETNPDSTAFPEYTRLTYANQTYCSECSNLACNVLNAMKALCSTSFSGVASILGPDSIASRDILNEVALQKDS